MRILFYVVLILLLSSCSSAPEEKNFDFFLSEPCMITNLEQNNSIEGTQLRVLTVDEASSTITLKIPENISLFRDVDLDWTVGWGTGKPYFDAGVENIREISGGTRIRPGISKRPGLMTIILGVSKRGEGFPRVGQRIVLWNSTPSGYLKVSNAPVIQPNFWPEFHGESIAFSSIVFDKYRKVWITLVNEVDSDKIQIYAAISEDLVHWRPANNGKPILTGRDFIGCSWTGQTKTPMVSEIIQHEGKYYVFMDGEDQSGKRHIGLATAIDLLSEYSISKKPILSPQSAGSWNENAVFCAKIAKRKNDFILFFDGRNENGYEQIGRATSTDLTTWKMDSNPVLDQHEGWRSAGFTTEPNYVEVHGDTVLLMAAGAKQFQDSYWHRYITHQSHRDRSGNVNDAQLGAFISTDGGKTFHPHTNNPIFVNSYSDPFENEHMGGNFERIETDSISYIFYQAKSSFGGMKYSIFLRKKSI